MVWPNGAVPSTHILKPAGIYDADEVEHATMMLSKMVGIETPESDIQNSTASRLYRGTVRSSYRKWYAGSSADGGYGAGIGPTIIREVQGECRRYADHPTKMDPSGRLGRSGCDDWPSTWLSIIAMRMP